MYKIKGIILLSAAVLLLFYQGQATAETDWSDSGLFPVDLLTFPKGGACDYQDSPEFNLDLHGIYRTYGDSLAFAFSYQGPPPTQQTGEFTGVLYDSKTGQPLAGATISIAGKPSIQTDQYGRFSFSNVTAGQITVTITKAGYYSVTQTITAGQNSTSFAPITVTPQAAGNDPIVAQIQGKFFSPSKHCYYLNGPTVIETITATIDWKGKTPKEIKWLLPNGTTYTDPVPGNTCSRIFDMGNIGLGKLTLTAIAADSITSAPKQANFEVIPPPPGIPVGALIPNFPGGALIPNFLGGNCLRYSTKYTVGFVKEGVEEGVVPDKVWGFGGYAFEFVTMVSLSVEVSDDGTASAIVEVPLDWDGMKLAGVKIKPKMSGSLKWQYSSEQQKWLSGGSFLIGVLLDYTTPPYYAVIPIFPPIPVYLRGALKLDLSSGFSLEDWAHDGKPILKGVIIFDPSFALMGGVGVADVFAIEGCGETKAHVLLIFPNENPLEELSFEVNVKITWVVWIFHQEYNLANYKWSLFGKEDAPALMPLGVTGLEGFNAGNFQIMYRDYLGPDYAIWQPTHQTKQKGFITLETPPEPNEEKLLQYNVFSQSQPTLAADGNDLLLAWIYDDPNRDPGDPNSVNRTEVLFSSCRNGNWSGPIPIDNDGTADFSPQIVALPNGDALCVWENAKQSLPNDVNLTEMARAMEVVASYYNSSSETWNSYALSNNNHLDRSPRIAAADNGSAIAVWIYNDKDDLLGQDSNALNEIRYSTFNGSTWTEPNTVATGVGLIIKTALTYNGNKATYVYSLDLDHNWQTDADRELFAAIYDGEDWSGPYRITDDNLIDANPQVVYDDSNILLVWYHDANLVSCRNFDPNTFQQILLTSGSSGSMDFRLAKSPTGQISLVWTDTSVTGVDIFTTTYDSQLSIWSAPYQLTSDKSLERSIAATYAGANELALAYNKVEIIDHNGVPEPNRVDLYVLRHKIKSDLAIFSNDISFSVPNPLPGSTVDINAVIHNLGDVAEVNVPVAFYNGDPDSGGLLIKNSIITGPIPAGATATASASWLVPDTNEPQQIYVVIDRQFSLEDSDRSNNITSSFVLAPDLTVAGITSERIGPKMRCITTRIANSGTLPAHNIGVCLRRGSPTGQTLATFNISELKPGSFYDVWHNWNIAGIDFNDVEVPVYAIADYVNTIAEFNENNNIALASVQVGKSSDLTDDGRIDFFDFAILADSWKNRQADFSTLEKLAQNWLWQASWHSD